MEVINDHCHGSVATKLNEVKYCNLSIHLLSQVCSKLFCFELIVEMQGKHAYSTTRKLKVAECSLMGACTKNTFLTLMRTHDNFVLLCNGYLFFIIIRNWIINIMVSEIL